LSDECDPDYGIVRLHLVEKTEIEVSINRSGASTFQKWSLVWTPQEEVVVLYSSDVGAIGYKVANGQLVELIELTLDIRYRVDELYFVEYGKNAPGT